MGYKGNVEEQSVDSRPWVQMMELTEGEIGVESWWVGSLSKVIKGIIKGNGVPNNKTLHGPSSPGRLSGLQGRPEAHNPAAPSTGQGGWKSKMTSSGWEEVSWSFWRWDNTSAISLWILGTWNTLKSKAWVRIQSATWISIQLNAGSAESELKSWIVLMLSVKTAKCWLGWRWDAASSMAVQTQRALR